MTLGELIDYLDKYDPSIRVAQGFNNPHSYRGHYDQLAFEPCGETTVKEMLLAAKRALGTTYCGWKGGDFKMGEWTDCWIANMGESGESLSAMWLDLVLKHERVES